MNFNEKLIRRLDSVDSHVCVGLDSRYDRIPEYIKAGLSVSQAVFAFNKGIIDQTADLTAAYKMNVAFYGGFGAEGLEGLRLTNEYLRKTHPEIPLLADCKRSEMGESVKMIEGEIFTWLGFDCVMCTPWFGSDTIRDYLTKPEQGVCVYVHDSNPSAVEVQEAELADGRKLYELVTELCAGPWNTNGNLFVEAGATYPVALRRVREIVGEEMVILTAGVGIQGGKATDLAGVFGKNGRRLIVNSSRGIIFAGEASGASDSEAYFAAARSATELFEEQVRPSKNS